MGTATPRCSARTSVACSASKEHRLNRPASSLYEAAEVRSVTALFVFCGLPGVGKSAVSAYVAEQRGAVRHRSDAVRKSLFDDPQYTEAEKRATYDELLARAESDLERGEDVVLDATFKTAEYRDRAAALAERIGAEFVFVRVTCDSAVVRERMADREGISDADYEVYQQLAEAFEPVQREHVVVDNSGSLEATYERLDGAVLSVVEN